MNIEKERARMQSLLMCTVVVVQVVVVDSGRVVVRSGYDRYYGIAATVEVVLY